MEKAVGEFFKELGYERDEQTGIVTPKNLIYDRVALFAHGGFSMIFTSCFLNIPYPEFCTRFQHIGTSAVTSFRIDDSGDDLLPIIYQYGNDGHLYRENLLDEFDLRTF